MLEAGSIMSSKFRIERMLGRGGMGEVYAATHLGLGTKVALKFLNQNLLTNARVVERFLREARASAQLRNEHICRVLDVETHDGVPFIVMEMLEGTDLARLIRKHGPLDHATAADYVQQACAGLAEAHAAQIVHRDLKPGNLFLCRRPDNTTIVKVLDFGVAKSPAGEQDFSLTQTSNVIGSPGYMSPEQLRSSKVVDARSDVWGLGVILFELVVGRQPFRAEAITDLALAIAMDPTPPMPGFPDAYAAIVARCLEKDPAKRFPDVAELAVALAQFSPRKSTAQTTAVDRLIESGGHAIRARAASTPAPPSIHDEPTSIDERAPIVEPPAMTTLSAASGVSLAPVAPAPERRVPWIPVVAGCAAVGIVLALVIGMRGGPSQPAKQSHNHPTPKVEHVETPATPETPGPVTSPAGIDSAHVGSDVPAHVETPKPVPVEEPKPVPVEEPKPVPVEEPKPVPVEEPHPVPIEEPKPAHTDAAHKPRPQPKPQPKPTHDAHDSQKPPKDLGESRI